MLRLAAYWGPEIFLDNRGNLLRNELILVLDENGDPATLYADARKLSTVPNPFRTSPNGNGSFWTVGGMYTLHTTYDLFIAELQNPVVTGSASEWSLLNPVLEPGQIGIDTDGPTLKFGNGVSTWSALGGFEPSAATWMGAWAAWVTYAAGDGVEHDGSSFRSIQTGNVGHDPSTSPTWWEPTAVAGANAGSVLVEAALSATVNHVATTLTDIAGLSLIPGVTDPVALEVTGQLGIFAGTSPSTFPTDVVVVLSLIDTTTLAVVGVHSMQAIVGVSPNSPFPFLSVIRFLNLSFDPITPPDTSRGYKLQASITDHFLARFYGGDSSVGVAGHFRLRARLA